MFGSPTTYGPLNRVSAVSYQIINDNTGVIASFIRLIATGYNVLKDKPLFPTNLQNIQQEWARCITLALDNTNIDASQLSQSLHPLPLSIGMAIKKCIETLPNQVIKDLFTIQYTCQYCSKQESTLAIFESSNRILRRVCPTCQHQLSVTRAAVITSFTGQQMPPSFNQNNESYVLLSGFSRKDYVFSIFSDLFTKDQFHYALSCNQQAQKQFQINDMTFLDPVKANQWIQGTGKIIQTAGNLQFYMFFNLSYADGQMKHRLEQLYDLQPPPPQPVNTVQHDSPSQVLRQEEPKKKTVFNQVEIHPCMWIIIAILLAMFLISLVMLSIITHRLNSTMILNDLMIQNQAFLGLPTVQTEAQISSFLNSNSVQIQRKKLTKSQFSLYTDQIYAQNLTTNLANFQNSQTAMNCTGDVLQLTTTTLTNPQVTNLNLNVLNSNNLTFTGTLQFGQNIDLTKFNINKLTASNLIANTIIGTDLQSQSDLNIQNQLEILGQLSVLGETRTQSSNLQLVNTNTASFNNLIIRNSLTVNSVVQVNFPVQVQSSVTIADTLLPTMNFNQNSDLAITSILNIPNAVNFQYNGNLTVNATTNINNLFGANLKLNNSNLTNLKCGGPGAANNCDIIVPNITNNQQITTATFTNNGNLNTPNVNSAAEINLQNLTIVTPQNQFLTSLNSTGISTLLPYQISTVNPVQISPGNIVFGQQITTPAIVVNSPATALSATAQVINSQILNCVNLTSETASANPVVTQNLTAKDVEAVQANVLRVQTSVLSIQGVCDSLMCLSGKCTVSAGNKICKIYDNGQINADQISGVAICQSSISPPVGANCFA